MNINESARNWTQLGKEDPMWAILSGKEKRGNKWEKEEFFSTGREDIKNILDKIQESGFSVRFGTALDFGCGIGRLSQALAARFEKVHGVDISESMIQQARQHNAFGDAVTYHLNVKSDLSLLPRNHFDFICSIIVLQHIRPEYQVLYIADFMELLAPGGVAFFQTIHARGLRAAAPGWLVDEYRRIKHKGRSYLPMYGVTPSTVRKVIEEHGGYVQQQQSVRPADEAAGRFASDLHIVGKKKVVA